MEFLKRKYKTKLTRFLLVYALPLKLPSLFPIGSQVKVESLKFQGIWWNGWNSSIAFLSVLQMWEGFPHHISGKGAESWEGFVLLSCYRLLSACLVLWGTGPASRFFLSELECMFHPEGAELRHERGDLGKYSVYSAQLLRPWVSRKQREAQLVALLLCLCLLMTWKLLVLC